MIANTRWKHLSSAKSQDMATSLYELRSGRGLIPLRDEPSTTTTPDQYRAVAEEPAATAPETSCPPQERVLAGGVDLARLLVRFLPQLRALDPRAPSRIYA